MRELTMNHATIFLVVLVFTTCSAQLFDFQKLKSYSKLFNFKDLYPNATSNQLWQGILKDCSKKTSFSCIQKNVFTYLDDTLEDRENITVFDGLTLTKNSLDYHKYSEEYNVAENKAEMENHIDGQESDQSNDDHRTTEDAEDLGRSFEDNYVEPLSPLEEVTTALREKAIKFMATRDYELQLPDFFFEGASIKLSPKEVDEDGALIRIDFKQRALTSEGRIFKKIKKLIQNKLITSFLALLLIIKLIKIKFMFIIPFLFGVGTAKKLFLKLLLFLVPAFAHVFKLCSSYYSAGGTKYHHHHHQIAHHHHHVPVPVPVPTYHDHHPHIHDAEEFDGYDYPQPHIQYRKDVEELKEWGIEPYIDPVPYRGGPYAYADTTVGPYGMPQYAPNARPVTLLPSHSGPFDKYVSQTKHEKPPGIYENPNPNIRHTLNNIGMTQFNKNFGPKIGAPNLGAIGNHAQNLAYNGYVDELRYTRAATPVTEATPLKLSRPVQQYQQKPQPFYGPQIRPGGGYPKAYGFLAKSGNADPWLDGSTSTENLLRSTQTPVKSPQVFSQIASGSYSVPQAPSGSSSAAIPSTIMTQGTGPVAAGPQIRYSPTDGSMKNPQGNLPVYKHQSSQNGQNKGGMTIGSVEAVRLNVQQTTQTNPSTTTNQLRPYDDEFYGPILNRLEDIFMQLRFIEEECRERLVCSMYKNPSIYTPSSNLVSNELSRDPEELKRGNSESNSGRRFHRYLKAARSGQDRGDCLRLYPCAINTE